MLPTTEHSLPTYTQKAQSIALKTQTTYKVISATLKGLQKPSCIWSA